MPLTYLGQIQKEFSHLQLGDEVGYEVNEEESDNWTNEGQDLLDAGQLAEAEQKFKAVIVANPDWHGGFEGLAKIYAQQGHPAEARYFQHQAIMRARRFLKDKSLDNFRFDEMFAAYRTMSTSGYAQMDTAMLVKAMVQSNEHPDGALLREILNRKGEAVPYLRQALRDDIEVTYVSDFATQLLANLKLNGVNEADEAVPDIVDIFRRIDDDFLDFLASYLSVFGTRAAHELLAVIDEGKLNWLQQTSAYNAAIAAADSSDEVRADIASRVRNKLIGYIAREEADDDNLLDEPYVASLICDLMELRDQSSLPLMQQAFALGLADESVVGEAYVSKEMATPREPTRWTFDADWLSKHELSLLNAVHKPVVTPDPSNNNFSLDEMVVMRKLRDLLSGRPALSSPTRTPFTAEKKPSRNDPCWCGSGKKYKHCHLREDDAKALK